MSHLNENALPPKPEPSRERTYNNYEKVELNNYHTLKNSSTIVSTGSGYVLAIRKNIDQDPGIQEEGKAYFEQLMTPNKPYNSNELDALEGRGEIQLAKNSSENDFPNNSSLTPIERTATSLRAGFTSMNERYLKSHKIDKTIFESDSKIQKEYNKLVKSNESLKKKFDALEKNLSQGHFSSGREKGFQQWSNNIYYVGSKGDGARIYYKFIPDKFEVEILAYSNKSKQTSITKRMDRLYDN